MEDKLERNIWMGAMSFLFNFTYSKLPTPDNLMRLKISEYNKCRCEECGN